MDRIFKLLLGLCILTCPQSYLGACTAFQLKALDGSCVYCRSMEFGVNLESNILIAPRGSDYQGTAPNHQKGLAWKSKLGFVGINQWISPNFVSDGMNEKGLVVGVLYLPGYAEYEKPDANRNDKTLGAWELAGYLLGTCANLDEVKSALNQVIVAQQPLPNINFSLPLHFYIADNKGKVMIVEFVNGKKNIYDDTLGILTNSPPLDWHLINLSNFVNLSPLNVPELQDLKNDTIKPIGQGSGLLGIPGDYTPPSRFVRAALYSQWAAPEKTGEETVRSGFHILNTFDIFFGIIREKGGDSKISVSADLQKHLPNNQSNQISNSEYTQWTVVHDRTNLKTYFRTYDSLQIQMVDLNKLNFAEPGFKEIKVQQNFTIDDITEKAQPLKV